MKTILNLNLLVRCLVVGAFIAIAPNASVAQLPNALQISDSANTANTLLYYTNQLADDHRIAATNSTGGFHMSVVARLVDDSGGGPQTMVMAYGMSNKRFLIWWDLDGSGNLVANLDQAGTYTLTTDGTGTALYHTHEIIYNPTNGTASYLFDGLVISNNWAPSSFALAAGEVRWGASASGGRGRMNFNRITFAVTNTIVASYDAGTVGNPAVVPDPTNSVPPWRLFKGAGGGTSQTNISPDVVSLPFPLVATTLAATNVRPQKATLAGAVNLGGLAASAWMEWGTTTNFGNASTPQFLKATTHTTSNSAVVTGLVAGVTYYFRCVATNVLGIAYGQPVAFTTPATWVVTNLTNSGPGTLRQAIDEAAAGDTITFAINGTILLTSQFNVSNSITILGPGPANLRIDAGGNSRLFRIVGGTNVFAGITLTNGHAPNGTAGLSGLDGGAIHNIATLTLSNCVVTGNRTGNGANGVNPSDSAGYGGNGGGIFNAGVLTLIACVVTNNATGRGGNGVDGAGGTFAIPDGHSGGSGGQGGSGGGVYSLNVFTAVDSVISANTTGNGGNAGNGSDAFNLSFGDGGDGGNGGSGGWGAGLYLGGTVAMVGCQVETNSVGSGGDAGSGGTGALGGNNGPPGFAGSAGEGGGVMLGANSSISDCLFVNNSASYGGGILVSGSATLNNCSISDNLALHGGGILAFSALLTLNDCTLNDNTATDGGGLNVFDSSAVVIRRSTFAANIANRYGGGIYNVGTLRIENSTIAQNRSMDGGGIYHTLSTSQPLLALNNCTLSGNLVTVGGNAAGLFTLNSSFAAITNSILAGNVGGPNFNTSFMGINNLIFGNAMLSALGNYGGLTRTMPPLPNSPAINAGVDSVTNSIATDQRGYSRRSGAHVDIGAVEVQFANQNNPPVLAPPVLEPNGTLRLNFTNDPAIDFSVYASTNVVAPADQWLRLGAVVQTVSGQYQYVDLTATNHPQRFYKVGSP